MNRDPSQLIHLIYLKTLLQTVGDHQTVIELLRAPMITYETRTLILKQMRVTPNCPRG
jgi:hypothetical protein